jgi:hypothetical protein
LAAQFTGLRHALSADVWPALAQPGNCWTRHEVASISSVTCKVSAIRVGKVFSAPEISRSDFTSLRLACYDRIGNNFSQMYHELDAKIGCHSLLACVDAIIGNGGTNDWLLMCCSISNLPSPNLHLCSNTMAHLGNLASRSILASSAPERTSKQSLGSADMGEMPPYHHLPAYGHNVPLTSSKQKRDKPNPNPDTSCHACDRVVDSSCVALQRVRYDVPVTDECSAERY